MARPRCSAGMDRTSPRRQPNAQNNSSANGSLFLTISGAQIGVGNENERNATMIFVRRSLNACTASTHAALKARMLRQGRHHRHRHRHRHPRLASCKPHLFSSFFPFLPLCFPLDVFFAPKWEQKRTKRLPPTSTMGLFPA